MNFPAVDAADDPAEIPSTAGLAETAVPPDYEPAVLRRNFVLLAAFQVVMRCGWIFKTESIIMPLVLNLMGGTAWLLGFLPLLNRLGQSVPPLLMARRIKVAARKKLALAACAIVMALSFFVLAGLWRMFADTMPAWMPLAFLAFYAVFFASTGVNQLAFGTLQGKLVVAQARGRLMLASNVAGAVLAIGCVAWLLPYWLTDEVRRFEWIFGFAGLCFAGSAMLALLLDEPPDRFEQPPVAVHEIFADAWSILRRDANFRRLSIVAATFSASIILFPHYQSLGRGERMGIGLSEVIWWVIVQNAGTALFSILAGPIADGRGNRLALRVVLLLLCAAPTLAIALSHVGPAGNPWFPAVFLLVGLTPVVYKVFMNYALEVCPAEDHPRYLSTMSLCMAGPILFSPLVGWLIEPIGYDAVFLGITSIVLAGWLLTFRLDEPRQQTNVAE